MGAALLLRFIGKRAIKSLIRQTKKGLEGLGGSISVEGADEMNETFIAADPGASPEFMRVGIRRAAFAIQRTAQTETIAIGRAKNAPPLPDMLTSRRGGAGIVGSIAVDFSDMPEKAHVGSHLFYATLHEFGIGTPKRAWLVPAVERNIDFLESVLADGWQVQIDIA